MVNGTPRILLYGMFGRQNFEFCWREWLQTHHYPVQAFDHSGLLAGKVPSKTLQRLMWRFLPQTLVLIVSQQFVKVARDFQPELVLIVSGNLVSAAALRTIRQEVGATLFHFYGEDFFNPLNTAKSLRSAAYEYDHLFTTKTFNVPELAEIGLRQVSYIPHGYRPNCHFPVTSSQADRQRFGSDLSFVGTWEKDRALTLAQLKEFDLRIWGNQWHKADLSLGLQDAVQNQAFYCEEMSRIFNAAKINLAFLRKANRDRHTSRTFEIPACGGFQLSERTDEVLSFFDEGKEIECFNSVEELKDKAQYYLKHETERQRIAKAGLERVLRSPYSYTDRIDTILQHYLNTGFG